MEKRMLQTTRMATIAGANLKDLNYPIRSLTPIEGVDIEKNYRVNALTFMKFKKGNLTSAELKEAYYRQLDARGKHLIGGDLRDLVLVCDCPNKVHKGDCAVKLLRGYLNIKEDINTLEDMTKVDYMEDFNNEVVDARCPHCSTEMEADDETGMYCPECDDLILYEDMEK